MNMKYTALKLKKSCDNLDVCIVVGLSILLVNLIQFEC